jgi:hypothetical protein
MHWAAPPSPKIGDSGNWLERFAIKQDRKALWIALASRIFLRRPDVRFG